MTAFTVMCLSLSTLGQSVGINTTGAAPNGSAILDVQSTSKGMLVPRMTTTQRTGIASPATGLLVFDNTTGSFWFKSASRWVELIDSSNTVWTKSGSNVYLNNGENVGVGTPNPGVRLQVDNGTDLNGASGGFLQLGSTSATNLAFDNNELQARNNLTSSDFFMQLNGGKVGIGTADLNPDVKLQVEGGTNISGTGGGVIQFGSQRAVNLAIDNNEIQARNGTATSPLYLQNSGGDVVVGSTSGLATSDLQIRNGKLTQPTTGNFNMIPLCYGHINANGTIFSATPNVSVTRFSAGDYGINCNGITSSSVIIITMVNNLEFIGGASFYSTGRMDVSIQNIKDVIDDPGGFQSNDDKGFYFIIYNP